MTVLREIHLVREALETALPPARVSHVLFQVLERYGRNIPQTRKDLFAMVRGPLATLLTEQLGVVEARDVVQRVEEILGDPETLGAYPQVTVVENDVPDDSPEIEIRADLDDTTAVPLSRTAVPVFLVASTDSFAATLTATLGPKRVSVATVSDPARLERAAAQELPAIVLVDAADLTSIEPELLVRIAERFVPGSTLVVWGTELPYGQLVARALEESDVHHALLQRSEGIDPLLDILRSRRDGDDP